MLRPALLILTLAGAGCSPPSPSATVSAAPVAASSTPTLASGAPAASAAKAAPAPASKLTLVVAGEEGVREIRADGSVLRVLSKTPARRPRLDGKDVYFYAPKAGELRRVPREGGAESVVATLPRSFKACGKLPDHPKGHTFSVSDLSLHEDADFVVDTKAQAACLALQDRNANMVNVRVKVRVELASGQVSHRIDIGGECTKPTSVTDCAAPAEPASPSHPAFAVASLGLPDSVKEEAVSPSGRWSLLGQVSGEGDYIHRALYLLDREKKSAYPLAAGPFPKALSAAQLAKLPDQHNGTVDAVGESEVRWLDANTLLVSGLLVTPEQGAVKIEGDVAR